MSLTSYRYSETRNILGGILALPFILIAIPLAIIFAVLIIAILFIGILIFLLIKIIYEGPDNDSHFSPATLAEMINRWKIGVLHFHDGVSELEEFLSKPLEEAQMEALRIRVAELSWPIRDEERPIWEKLAAEATELAENQEETDLASNPPLA